MNLPDFRVDKGDLTIRWPDGHVSVYPAIWLYDNQPVHRDASTGQRLAAIHEFPANLMIENAAPEEEAVLIRWRGVNTACSFSLAWLLVTGPDTTPARRTEILWRSGHRPCVSPTVSAAWLDHLISDGIAFLENVPCENGRVLDVASAFGIVSETNYGRLFDVRAVENPENLAYTHMGLGLHTDNPYRDPVPGFQALHMLSAVEGGASLFADGFAIAAHLAETDRDAFNTLTSTPVPFEFHSRTAHFRTKRPLLQTGPNGEVEAVHFNERAMAPLQMPVPQIRAFYAAYRQFAELLRDPAFVLPLKLKEGDLVVFDNQRVLHGRTAFANAGKARWLQGCYLSRDSVFSSWRISRKEGPE